MTHAPTSSTQGRDLLIQAGKKLFLAHGYADVSMQAIAEEAGMTKGAPYYHFASKQDLFLQVSMAILDNLLGTAEAALTADGPFEQRVKQAMLDVVQVFSGDLSRWYSDVMQMPDTFGFDKAMLAEFGVSSPISILTPAFAQAREEGAFTRVDAEAANTVFFVLLKTVVDHSALEHSAKLPSGLTIHQLIDVMVDIYFNGIR